MSVPRISLCTFVKNEENCIARMISSVIEYVDEVVLVDTGSTDKTIEVAKEACFKRDETQVPIRIYKVGFTNFAEIRTLSSHLAQYEYVLMLDADEELSNGSNLKSLMIDVDPDVAYAFPRRRWLDLERTKQTEIEAYPDWQVRFYKNYAEYTWKRELHEYFDGAAVSHLEEPGGPIIEHFQDVHKGEARLKERKELYERLAIQARVTVEGGYEI